MAGVALPKLHGLVTIDSTLDNFNIVKGLNPTRTIALAQASYYIRTGLAGTGLVEQIQSQVATFAEFSTTFTATVSNAGFVTLADTGGNFTVTWTEVGLRAILGYTGDLSGASSYTAANQHRYGWYPNVAPATMAGHPNRAGARSSDAVVRRARSGAVVTTKYAEYTDQLFHWRFLEDEYVFPTGSVVNRDLEQFWSDILSRGTRFRYYPDRADNATFYTYVAGPKIAAGGTRSSEPEQANWSKLWALPMDLYLFV